MGRIETVTNGSYRESEFNDGFRAMNLKRPTDAIVKGCQMPALHRMSILLRQNSGGRRRTSLEGGNRGLRSRKYGSATLYGDLKSG
jgi:hypothetical protein